MRKLATAAAVSLVLASGGVRALGLGDIEMRSALNQPMNAEIRLTSVQPGEADGMIVKLASPDAFSRAGIERTSALTDLRFSVDTSTGTPVIRISSSRAVVEPFLNFLLEVDWPAGRMVREYTVLLDPPVFMTPSAGDRNTLSEQPAILQRSDTSLIAPAPIERDTFDADSFEVEIVGSAVEISDSAVLPSNSGDVISLDNLGSTSIGEVLVTDDSAVSFDGFADQGDVVSLTDLGVANPVASAQFQNDQLVSGADYDFNVEIVGSSSEVSDAFVADGLAGSSSSFDVSSEIVSLDSLDSGVVVGGGGGEVTVQRGDTLAAIAQQNAVQGVSSQQMMMALLNANQGAFINGNVNLVKAGAILRIPDGGELSQMTQAQAVAQMGEQNQLWREYRDSIRGSSGTRVAANTQAPAAPQEQAISELSDAAQRILDAAKDETLNRQELNIVGESDSTTAVASATADNSESGADAQLGEINKKLQLAKEELASTRLESTDLGEQSAELQSTAENMDSLVSIRQQEVARLQAQLSQASVDSDGEGGFVDNAQGLVAGAGGAITDSAGNVTDAAQNALTTEGQELPEVELVAEPTAPEVDIRPPAVQTPWYTELLQKYGKWIVIGLGVLSALGLGFLLLGKRRKKDDDDRLDYADDVEFFDDEDDGVQFHTEGNQASESTGIGSAVAAGVAGAAAVGGATAAVRANADDGVEAEYEDEADVELGSHMDAIDDGTNVQEDLDPDDTISEVDVYLAYGLHGQAEELLAKAIERDPNNPEYALKLLQTQHAQGNGDAFSEGAESYHERFGGEGSPEWSSVCEMGYDLQPNNILFASSETSVQSVGKGDFDAPKLDDGDFSTDTGGVGASSVSRDFGDASDAPMDDNESDLMDQSLDPAFAFDETDLEATGDFSQIANEIASEEVDVSGGNPLVDDNSLDFPDFDAGDSVSDKLGGLADSGKDKLGGIADAGKGKLGGIGGGIGAGIGGIAAGGAALAGGLGSKAASAKDSASEMFDDALSLDDLDVGGAANDGVQSLGQASVAEDLTLDLDQLSGDLELDGTDLLDDSTSSVDSLEMPDLTSDNDLINENVGGLDSSDEMDTMMDLAKAYIDMGDKDSASSALGEIVKSGNPAQVSEAETLLRKIS